MPTLVQLEAELISLVKGVPAFSDSGFSAYDMDDLEAKSAAQSLPTIAVMFDGSLPHNHEVTPTSQVNAASLMSVQFLLVVAVQYGYTGQSDSKQQAFALLDQVRSVVLGFKGVNSRPWRFIGERPEPNASGDGIVLYSQAWQTTLPIIGNFNTV